MPTYAYACTECGHRFEAVQSFSDPALSVCPECDGRLRKEYGSIGVTFSGSGFYRTDSRAGEAKKRPKSESTGSSGAGSPSPGRESGSSSPSPKPEAKPSAAPSGA